MGTSFWESKRRYTVNPLTAFSLPLVANLVASLLLKLLPLGEIALRSNAAYQGCLFLAVSTWYRQGGKNGVREEQSLPWRDFAETLCPYLLLMLLLGRSGFAMSDRLYRSSAGALRNLDGQTARATSVVYTLCGAVTEELLFHGVLGWGLTTLFGRSQQLACGNALLLAFYHGNSTQGLLAFPLGPVLSRLRARGGLRVSIAAHLSTNLLALRLQAGKIDGERVKRNSALVAIQIKGGKREATEYRGSPL